MKVSLMIASINEMGNIAAFKSMLKSHDCRVIVIDKGEEKIRKKKRSSAC